jgi:pantoate kinase
VRARAPGSVTTAFAPAGEDGGGISLATEAGVVAEVTPAAATRITLDGESTAFEPVAIALERLGVCAEVALEAAVPVGRGFGASGAATLATVLAAAAEFDLDRDRAALVDLAADAERAAGTGQSDVYVQETGGLAYDAGAGRGRRERTDRVAWATWAGVSTAAVLGDAVAMERIGAAAAPVFERFDPGADLATLLDLGWSFARETGLVTDRVREAVERVRAAGGAATMAMVGETVVTTPDAPLSAPAFDGAVTGHTRVDTRGAELLD